MGNKGLSVVVLERLPWVLSLGKEMTLKRLISLDRHTMGLEVGGTDAVRACCEC